MDEIVFGSYSVQDLIIAGAILVVLVVAVKILFRKKPDAKFTQAVHCECGWQGNVSTIAGRCPKCNKPLGQRKAGP